MKVRFAPVEVSMEDAHEILERADSETVSRIDAGGVSIVSYKDQDRGWIYVTLPAFGNAVLLPFEPQISTC